MKSIKVTQQDYEILLDKYHKKNSENKKLKQVIEQMIKANQDIENNYKSTLQLYDTINNSIQQIRKDQNSTASTTFNTGMVSSDGKQSSPHLSTKSGLQKKLEEMEGNYNEMVKNFGLLVDKYKIIKEDKDNLEESRNKITSEMNSIKNEKDRMQNEYNHYITQIERYKEIDKCLVDTIVNSFILNTGEKKEMTMVGNNPKNTGAKYITCEPVPTFVRFINKYSDIK
jgi:chromosome segregation ATPase